MYERYKWKTKAYVLSNYLQKYNCWKGSFKNLCRPTYSKVAHIIGALLYFHHFQLLLFNSLPAVIAKSQDINSRCWDGKTPSNWPIKCNNRLKLWPSFKHFHSLEENRNHLTFYNCLL